MKFFMFAWKIFKGLPYFLTTLQATLVSLSEIRRYFKKKKNKAINNEDNH